MRRKEVFWFTGPEGVRVELVVADPDWRGGVLELSVGGQPLRLRKDDEGVFDVGTERVSVLLNVLQRGKTRLCFGAPSTVRIDRGGVRGPRGPLARAVDRRKTA